MGELFLKGWCARERSDWECGINNSRDARCDQKEEKGGRGFPPWVLVARTLVEYLLEASKTGRSRAAAKNPLDLLLRFAADHLWASLPEGKRVGLAASEQWENEFKDRIAFNFDPLLLSGARAEGNKLSGNRAANCLVDTPRGSSLPAGEFTLRILISYPVLLRLLSLQMINWWRFTGSFWRDLKRSSFDMQAIGAIDPGLSDLHEGNRSVVRIDMDDDLSWFYKPRNGELERGWYRVLNWANGQGFSKPFKIVPGHQPKGTLLDGGCGSKTYFEPM